LKVNIPKVKIDEICFVIYSTPSQITKTTKLSERENVIFRLLPKDLSNELNSICAEFEYHADKVLRPAIRGKLYFIKYPLAKYKPRFDKLIMEYNEKLKKFADKIFNRIDELRGALAEFCQKYGLDRELNEAILTRDYLYTRFKIKCQLLPIKLSESLNLEIFTKEDIREIEADVKEMVQRSYRDLLNQKLAEFFNTLGQQLKRLQSGKMVTAHTLAKMRGMYDEVAQALSITDDKRYEPAFEIMTQFLDKISQHHEDMEKIKTSRRAVKMEVWEALETAKAIAKKAKTILPKFEEIVLEDVTSKPAPSKRDDGIRELIRGIEL